MCGDNSNLAPPHYYYSRGSKNVRGPKNKIQIPNYKNRWIKL